MAFAIFLLVKQVNRLKGPAPVVVDSRDCPLLPVEDSAQGDALSRVHLRGQTSGGVRYANGGAFAARTYESIRHGARSDHCRRVASALAAQAPKPDPSKFLTQPLIPGHLHRRSFRARLQREDLHLSVARHRRRRAADDLGSHFAMRDYHVFSMDTVGGKVTDHGVALDIKNVAWAGRQMWAPDAAEKGGKYYLYFPVKDKQDVFRIGAAVGTSPAGPFTAQADAIKGTYSIDPAVFKDTDGKHYMYFGGIWGGQLQRWASGAYKAEDVYPAKDQPALSAKVARLGDDMVSLAEAPKDVVLLDEKGKPLTAGDNGRRFFEASWLHKYKGTYYFSYSTGDTHFIVYATGTSPYGPFTVKGKILEPVLGWTNHHSIVEFQGKWYLFYHDAQLSDGQTHLRNIKVTELKYREDGSIVDGRRLPELIHLASRQQQLQILSPQIANQAGVGAHDRVGQSSLRGLQLEHLLLDGVARDEPVGEHGPRLPDAVRAVDRLRLDGRVPPRVEQEHVLGGGEVQAEAAGLQADEKQRAVRRSGTVDARLSVPRLSVEVLVGQPRLVEPRAQEARAAS